MLNTHFRRCWGLPQISEVIMCHLAFKLSVLSNVLDLARYTGIAAAKQVVWEGAGAVSNSPAQDIRW